MANESFAEFADTLQKEIEAEAGFKFGVLQISLFIGMKYTQTKTVEKTITAEQAEEIMQNDEEPIEAVKRELKENKDKMLKAAKTVLGNDISAFCINNSALVYTETVTEEKEVTYDEARELMQHFEDKGYVTKSGRIQDFLNNPHTFTENCLDIVRRNRHALAIDGIKYVKLAGQ